MAVARLHPDASYTGNCTVKPEARLMTGIITPIINIHTPGDGAALIAVCSDGDRVTRIGSLGYEESVTNLPVIVDELAFLLNIEAEARAVLKFD